MATLSIADSLAQGQCAEWQDIILATTRVKSLKARMSPVLANTLTGEELYTFKTVGECVPSYLWKP